jgi:protein-S-isoprenylcysteine O-methyltransferase Ste14
MPASKKPTLRRVLVYLGCALVFVVASPTKHFFAIGATLCVLGEALRVWACGHLRKNQKVVQSGPYAHVKNPLYLGTCLILFGMVLAASNPGAPGDRGASWYLLVLFLPFALGVFFFYYLPHKFRVEGGRLRRIFGPAWDEYDRKVPDFLPSPWPRVRDPARWDAALVVRNSEVSWVLLVTCALGVLALRMADVLPSPRLPW